MYAIVYAIVFAGIMVLRALFVVSCSCGYADLLVAIELCPI
jgi:hypothetical protein